MLRGTRAEVYSTRSIKLPVMEAGHKVQVEGRCWDLSDCGT